MEKLKWQTKRIVSMILAIIMLVSVMPNFGLLKTSDASDFQSGVILRLDTEKGIWTDSKGLYNAISLDIIMKDIGFTSFALPIKFDVNKLKPAYIDGEELEYASSATQFTKQTSTELSPYITATGSLTLTSWKEVDDGKILLNFYDTETNTFNVTGEALICTINFIVDSSITDINQIDTNTIDINEESNSFAIYNDADEEYYEDVDTYFTTEGITQSPTVKELSVKTNPTEGKKYTHGDKIELTGGELTVTYTDNSTKSISMEDENVTVKTGEEVEAIADANNPKLTFEYEGQSVELYVNVKDPVENIELYDKDGVLKVYAFNHNDSIPTDELFIKAVTKSGKEHEINLSEGISDGFLDGKITLNSYIADQTKLQNGGKVLEDERIVGIQEIEITYAEEDEDITKTTSFNILVNDVVKGIKISTTTPPSKEFNIYDEFKKDGAIVVTGEYTNESFEIDMKSDNVIVTEADGSDVVLDEITTSKELTVTYADFSIGYTIEVKNTVTEIQVNIPEDMSDDISKDILQLKHNKELEESDFDGVTITEIYADGTEGEPKALVFDWIDTTNYDKQSLIEQQLPITYPYGEKEIEGSIKVKIKNELVEIRIVNLKTDYVYLEELDYENAELYAEYSSGYMMPLYLGDIENTFDNTVIGPQEVTFTYDDGNDTATTTVDVNVGKAQLAPPECGSYTIAENTPLSTIADQLPTTDEGSVTWADGVGEIELGLGETKTVNAIYTPNDTVHYTSTTFEVTVTARDVESISITEEPDNPVKKAYYEGQAFDPSGMIITINYNNNTTKVVTENYDAEGITFTPSTNLLPAHTEVTVGYGSARASQAIKVTERQVTGIEITKPADDTEYVEGQTFNPEGMIITVTYNDNDTSTIESNYETAGVTFSPSTLQMGNTEVTVTYKEFTDTVDVEVIAKVVKSIKVKLPEDFKTEYIEGQPLDLTGMEVIAIYNLPDTDPNATRTLESQEYTTDPLNGAILSKENDLITVTYEGTDIAEGAEKPTATISIEVKEKQQLTIGDLTYLLPASRVYDGKPTAVKVTAPDGAGTVEVKYYDVNDINKMPVTPTNAGTYKVIVSVTEGTAYKALEETELEGTFTITKATPEYSVKGIEITYGETLAGKLATAATGAGTFTWDADETKTYDANEYTFVAKFEPSDTVNYNVVENISVKVIVKKARPDYDPPTGLEGYEGQPLSSINISAYPEFEWTYPNAILSGPTYSTTMTFTPTNTNNYEIVTDIPVNVTVKENKVLGIKITTPPADKDYYVKEKFDPTGMVVEAEYTMGEPQEVTDYEILDKNGVILNRELTITDDRIIVRYKGETAELPITVSDYETGEIVITQLPNKVTYKYGEDIDLTGGKVAKEMASGAKKDETAITKEMISGYNKEIVGTQTITVTYAGATTTFPVTVGDETTGIAMNTNPNKIEYTQGEAINLTGATINVLKLSGTSTIPVIEAMISGYNPNTVGQQVITVTYDGKTTTFNVNVKEKPVTPSTPSVPSTPKPSTPSTPKPSTPGTQTTPATGEVEKYTVTFINYDGTILKTEEVEKGNAATAPELEERKGYKFTGWNMDFAVVEADMTVIAQYEEIETAKIDLPGTIEVDLGGEPDLSDVVMEIFDEEGNKIKEVPVTMDMISGFNPNRVGTQEVTATYTDEAGNVYKTTFKVKVSKPVETLGEKDEVEPEEETDNVILPAVAGIGIAGLLLILIALLTKKNVKVYVVSEGNRTLIGKQKISKSNKDIDLDMYKSEIQNAQRIELEIADKAVRKLNNDTITVTLNGISQNYAVKTRIVIS